MMRRYCANLKAIKYESTSLNRIVADKSHRVIVALKGTSGREKSLAQMKERAKCKKLSHHRPQYAKWFSRYSISKSQIRAIWTSPFCRFLASIPLKYDVADAMLQDIEKMKVQYLMNLLFDLFEILQAVRSEQTNFAWL